MKKLKTYKIFETKDYDNFRFSIPKHVEENMLLRLEKSRVNTEGYLWFYDTNTLLDLFHYSELLEEHIIIEFKDHINQIASGSNEGPFSMNIDFITGVRPFDGYKFHEDYIYVKHYLEKSENYVKSAKKYYENCQKTITKYH